MRYYLQKTMGQGVTPTPRPSPSSSIPSVNFSELLQTMDGFGAADTDDKPAPLTSALRTLLWDPVNGIGLSIYRAQIGTDGTPRVDATDYPIFLWDKWGEMKAARAINSTDLRFIASPWTPPAAYKDNGSLQGGHLLPAHRTDWANVLASFVTTGAAQTPAIPFLAISVQNEPDLGTNLTSCFYTNAEMTAFCPVLQTALNGVSGTPAVMMAEPFQWPDLAGYITDWEANGTPQSAVTYYATHQYTGVINTPVSAKRHIWQTEMSGLAGGPEPTWDPTITDALVVAGWIHDAITIGNVSAWVWWWFMGGGTGDPPVMTDNEALIVFYNGSTPATTPTICKRLYAIGNFSKFVRPGWIRVQAGDPMPAGVKMTAYRHPTSGACCLVVINTNATATPLQVSLAGFVVTSLTPWVTSATQNLASQAAISTPGNVLSTVLAASSITTFQGTGA